MTSRGKPPSGHPDLPFVRDPPRENISERLKSAHDTLQSLGYATRHSTHRYLSGHVEGQLTVDVPRGTTATKTAIDIERALGSQRMGGYWLSAGVLFDMAKIEGVDYRRRRGSFDIQVYPQKATTHNFSEVLLIARKQIADKASSTLGRKPTSFYVRLYWSPDGSRPKRKGD